MKPLQVITLITTILLSFNIYSLPLFLQNRTIRILSSNIEQVNLQNCELAKITEASIDIKYQLDTPPSITFHTQPQDIIYQHFRPKQPETPIGHYQLLIDQSASIVMIDRSRVDTPIKKAILKLLHSSSESDDINNKYITLDINSDHQNFSCDELDTNTGYVVVGEQVQPADYPVEGLAEKYKPSRVPTVVIAQMTPVQGSLDLKVSLFSVMPYIPSTSSFSANEEHWLNFLFTLDRNPEQIVLLWIASKMNKDGEDCLISEWYKKKWKSNKSTPERYQLNPEEIASKLKHFDPAPVQKILEWQEEHSTCTISSSASQEPSSITTRNTRRKQFLKKENMRAESTYPVTPMSETMADHYTADGGGAEQVLTKTQGRGTKRTSRLHSSQQTKKPRGTGSNPVLTALLEFYHDLNPHPDNTMLDFISTRHKINKDSIAHWFKSRKPSYPIAYLDHVSVYVDELTTYLQNYPDTPIKKQLLQLIYEKRRPTHPVSYINQPVPQQNMLSIQPHNGPIHYTTPFQQETQIPTEQRQMHDYTGYDMY